MAPRQGNRAATLVALLLSAGALVALFRDINAFPSAGFDEWYFLARFERFIRYGDGRDVAHFDQFAGNGTFSKTPPLLFPVRFALHRVLGRGAEAARVIGAVQFAILALLVGLVARQRGAPREIAVLAPGMLLTFPTIFFFARTYRYEQEVFFTGTLSLLLPLLAGTSSHRRLACLVSGLLAGAAATMHPMGALFPAALALDHVARHGRALLHRGPPLRDALLWVGASAMPVLAVLVYYASDWQNTVVYWHGTRVFHQSHHPLRIRTLVASRPLPAWLPDQPAAALNAVRWGLRPFPVTGPASLINEVLVRFWGLGLVASAAAAAVLFLRRLMTRTAIAAEGAASPWRGVWSTAIFSAMVTTALYPANNDYVGHFAGLAWAGVYLAGAAWASLPASALKQTMVFLALASLSAGGLAVVTSATADPSGARGPTAPEQIDAMSDITARLHLGSDAKVYGDTTSWPGTGAGLAALHEYLILEVVPLRSTYAGVVFSVPWYNVFVRRISTFSGQPVDPVRRRLRMGALLEGLTFRACLVTENGDGTTSDTRLWLQRVPSDQPIFATVRAGGFQSKIGEALGDDSFAVPAAGFSITRSIALAPGRYAAMLTGSTLESSRLRVRSGGRHFDGLTLENFPHAAAGSTVLFEASTDGVVAQAEGTAIAAGAATIRYWRLHP